MDTTEYMNESRPPRVPVRPGTDPYPVRARLVALDGTEEWIPATAVRLAPGHVMCRIPGRSAGATSLGYHARPPTYVWLVQADVQG